MRLAEQYPDDMLERGEYLGYPYLIMHSGSGYRLGYILVPEDHPWRSQRPSVNVHGGITFAEDGWIGFDCAHKEDAPDPSLPRTIDPFVFHELSSIVGDRPSSDGHVWTTEEVKQECHKLIEEAESIKQSRTCGPINKAN